MLCRHVQRTVPDKLVRLYLQTSGESHHRQKAGVGLSTLKRPNIVSVELCHFRELFLRHPSVLSKLSDLFLRYARLVHSVGRRILRDGEEAEDLVQKVFLYVHRKSNLFDSTKGSARSWVLQIAYTQAFLRRRQLRLVVSTRQGLQTCRWEPALEESKGKVAGSEGAAAKLGIKRSTLDSKIKQLRIKNTSFISG
jgi:RNA polymerase sigma factor (sigma-70 family)